MNTKFITRPDKKNTLLDLFSRARHAQDHVTDRLDRPKRVGKSLNLFSLPPRGHNLQAVVVIEVDMLGGDNCLLKVVLHIHHTNQNVTLVMIVNEGDRTDHIAATLPFLLDEFLADQVPQGLRAVGVLFSPDQEIKSVQEGFLQGNTETNQFRHQITVSRYATL